MVEGTYVVVNVMLSLMIVMSPPPALCNISVRTVVKLCMSSAYARTGALGGGMSAVYMLNNVGERMSFCGTSDLN